jgi:hypothetical protein
MFEYYQIFKYFFKNKKKIVYCQIMWLAEHQIALLHNLPYRAAQPPGLIKVTITIHHPVYRSLAPKNYFTIVINTTDEAQTGTFEDMLTDIQKYPLKFPTVFKQSTNLEMHENDNNLEDDNDWGSRYQIHQMPNGEPDTETTYTYVVPGHCQGIIEHRSNAFEDYEMPVDDIRDALIRNVQSSSN